jgi:hypothetical protein
VQETQCGALEAHVYLTAHDNEPIKPGGAAGCYSDPTCFRPLDSDGGISGAPLDDRPPKLALRRLPKTPSCNQNRMRGARTRPMVAKRMVQTSTTPLVVAMRSIDLRSCLCLMKNFTGPPVLYRTTFHRGSGVQNSLCANTESYATSPFRCSLRIWSSHPPRWSLSTILSSPSIFRSSGCRGK